MINRRCKVLLIEDDKARQTAFERFVAHENLPYDYKMAESISEANTILAGTDFDVLIVGCRLDDGTGSDVLHSAEHTPVILITGAGDEEITRRILKAGACDYLVQTIERHYFETVPVAVENAVKQKMLQETIDRKQRNLQAIFDAVPIGMLLVDEKMIVGRVNDAVRRMVHKDYLEIINRVVCDALGCVNHTSNEMEAGCDRVCTGCLLRKAIASVLDSGQSAHEIEMQATLGVDGEEITRWLRISVEPVEIDGCKYVVIAVDDISDCKRAEEGLRESENKLRETMELKSQFISTVSHELRTPLTCVKEALAIVMDGAVDRITDKQKHFLDIAKRNIDRLARLISDVLDFRKLEAGRAELNVEQNDIVEVAHEVYTAMAPCAKEKEIEFLLELRDNLPKARFDRDKIIQVLTNLVSNAIKFTPERGRVSVCVQQQGDELLIRVNDTGMGIPEQDLPRIFERFYRVYRPGKQISGTGLGLTIVNEIVMMHCGRIGVESEVDRGTTFTVTLPLAPKSLPEVSPKKTDKLLEKTISNN